METNPGLSNEEIGRYSRQMILPELGFQGQSNLKNSSILVVGLGGLGSPASMFLAASGIGRLGLVDYDMVESSNLHRQIIHSEKTLGIPKSESARQFLYNLNSNVNIETFNEPFTNINALDIIKKFDVVLDCTDNAATRYLLNDAAVICKKPLISGSALRFEGQLITYNYQGGPCYRCLFPVPPPPEFVTNCSDGGVLGAVPGTIGTLQALEAIKLVSGIGASYVGKMLLFDGLRGSFTDVKLRQKQSNCSACGDNPTITTLLEDYPAFCGAGFDDKDRGVEILSENERISPLQYQELYKASKRHILIDVRDSQELGICALPAEAKNVPYSEMNSEKTVASLTQYLNQQVETTLGNNPAEKLDVFVVCRRGNDSQRAVKLLKERFSELPLIFKDIEGGLHRWAKDVDTSFPVY